MRPEAETRHAILRNARAQERERLTNLALRTSPGLTGADLEAKVRELEVAKLSGAGRKGRATQDRLIRTGRRWNAVRPGVEEQLEDLLAIIRGTNLDAADEQPEAS